MIGFYNYTVLATYLSLCSAVAGIWFSLEDISTAAMLCLLFSGLLDTFDGMIARTMKNRTEEQKRYGIQIDSLSDIVAFGVLPAAIGYTLCEPQKPLYLAVMSFYVLAALIRLGYYNVTEEMRQSTADSPRRHYQGLPVTSAALFVPILWCIKPFMEDNGFALLYTVCIAAAGILFITPLSVKKPGKKTITAMLLIGTAVAVILVVRWLSR